VNRHDRTFITGVLLLVLPDLAVRSLGFLVVKVAQCLAVAAAVYFLTSRSQWNDYVLPVYALPGAAGLLLAWALLTSRLVSASLSVLGIAFPLLLMVRAPLAEAMAASCPSARAGQV